MLEESLERIARQISSMNEDALTALLPKYKERMLDFKPTRQWEDAFIIYYLINALRNKNSIFNQKVEEMSSGSIEKNPFYKRPQLRLLPKKQASVNIECNSEDHHKE